MESRQLCSYKSKIDLVILRFCISTNFFINHVASVIYINLTTYMVNYHAFFPLVCAILSSHSTIYAFNISLEKMHGKYLQNCLGIFILDNFINHLLYPFYGTNQTERNIP